MVNFSEFTTMMAKNMAENIPEEDLREAFKMFDKNGDGKIDLKELRYVMTKTGDILTDDEVGEMIHRVDADGDGMVNYEGQYFFDSWV
jgi:calmodulin